MSITIPDPWLMLLVFVVFCITMFLLNAWLFKPLISYMDERENALRRYAESVASDNNEVQEIQATIATMLTNAKAQASSIVEHAIAEAKSNHEATLEKKRSDIQAKLEEFRSSLHAQKEQVRQKVLADLGDFESLLQAKIKHI